MEDEDGGLGGGSERGEGGVRAEAERGELVCTMCVDRT